MCVLNFTSIGPTVQPAERKQIHTHTDATNILPLPLTWEVIIVYYQRNVPYLITHTGSSPDALSSRGDFICVCLLLSIREGEEEEEEEEEEEATYLITHTGSSPDALSSLGDFICVCLLLSMADFMSRIALSTISRF